MTKPSSEGVSTVSIQVWINYDLYPTDESSTPWDAVDDPRKEYHNPEAFYSFKSVRKPPPLPPRPTPLCNSLGHSGQSLRFVTPKYTVAQDLLGTLNRKRNFASMDNDPPST